MSFGILKSPGKIEITLPIATVSEGNCFEPWQRKHARHKAQHKAIALVLQSLIKDIWLPCIITLIRFSPRLLDTHDNLPMSFKFIVDKIAELLTGKSKGKGDSDPRLTWKYSQEKSKDKGIKIILEF